MNSDYIVFKIETAENFPKDKVVLFCNPVHAELLGKLLYKIHMEVERLEEGEE